ncbi:MAG: TonB-dependent receptor [Bacteroidetes bacterium]|nr:MAG: TonB-dependent receptor [Bacteroidota bacterium]
MDDMRRLTFGESGGETLLPLSPLKLYMMRFRLLMGLWLLALPTLSQAQQRHTLSGYVYDAASGEALTGSTVRILGTAHGTYTNTYGFFSLTLPEGRYQLASSYLGFMADTQWIDLRQPQRLEIRMEGRPSVVEEVVISAACDAYRREVASPQMSQIQLDIRQVKHLPNLGGEPDLMKVVQLLPGVAKGGEGTTSILVRGGDPDQNLILLDEAVVYNVSHLFGFFSVFNPDALKDLTVIKGGFPAQYGGRLSSVLDVTMQEGNQRDMHVKGGIGLLSSRLTVEGPIVRDRGSFSISGRRSYIDQALRVAKIRVPYYFYDLNAKANYRLSERDRLYLSFYRGDDVLYNPDLGILTDSSTSAEDAALFQDIDFGFKLGNFTSTLRWNHLFSDRLFSNTSAIFTRFDYDIRGAFAGNEIFVGSDVRDLSLKTDFGFYHSPAHTLRFGGQVIQHRFRPNVISAAGDISALLEGRETPTLPTLEAGLYVQHEWQIASPLRLHYGVRFAGAATPGKAYLGPEPRASLVYTLGEKASLKLGYARMQQYVHLVSSASVALPTDLWYPVTETVRPQVADQIAFSYSQHLESLGTLLTVESYYKRMYHLTEYREGANLLFNDRFEDELLQGEGEAYGVEFLLKRDEGRFTGWIGYTLSWSRCWFDELNGGAPFWAKYDRRHDLSLVGVYQITDRLSASAVYTYLSGPRFTPQTGQYLTPTPGFDGVEVVPIYADRNAVRLTAANRLDVSLSFRTRPGKRFQSEWTAGCYNVLNAPAPVRVHIAYTPEAGVRYTQPSFLGLVPSVGWNFEF